MSDQGMSDHDMSDQITIRAADGASATISLHGAEPVSWRVGGRDYLWSGDPAHWNRCAPWLFPVVGASAGGIVRVDGVAYPMGQHGFARDRAFDVVAQADDAVTLRLADDDSTRAHYPFGFRLDITARISADALAFEIAVENTGPAPLPYALGFHPAFPWPFAEGERAAGGGYAVVFEHPEDPMVPNVGPGGLLVRDESPAPIAGDTLALDPAMFEEAFVFRDAASRRMRFTSPGGQAIVMRADDFPHLAVWTKPTAPFLSLECWTGHADWAGFAGELSERDSQRALVPGAIARHGVRLSLEG